jgi:TfoX/Sxy family transcriptional regulator of competence genes
MNVPKPTPETVDYFGTVVPDAPDVVKKTVFGYPACFVNGNMFMGVHDQEIILRLGDEKRRQFLGEESAAIFEPMPGRPMKEYAVVPLTVRADTARMAEWVGHALAFGRALPAKEKKPKAAKKK